MFVAWICDDWVLESFATFGTALKMNKQQLKESIEKAWGSHLFLTEELSALSNKELEESLTEMPDYEDYLSQKAKLGSHRLFNQPDYYGICYIEPLFSNAQELHQFRKYNVLKCLTKRYVDSNLRKARKLYNEALVVRSRIFHANCRLVISVLNSFPYKITEESVSDGMVILHNALERFDWTRGLKFSTYTTWALRNSLQRCFSVRSRDDERFVPVGLHEDLASKDMGYEREKRQQEYKERVDHLLSTLGERNKSILIYRYGLNGKEPKTLKEVGQLMGVTKERIRQLETNALQKLRLVPMVKKQEFAGMVRNSGISLNLCKS